jgi:hypothetical protein
MVDTKTKSSPDLGRDKWQIYLHCDVLVERYWLGLLSQAAKNSKLCIWTAFYLILKQYSSNYSPPPHTFWNLPFHHSLCASSLSPAAFTFYLFLPLFDPSQRPGSWALDKVKRRLRRQQVVREQAASARYRQEEERHNRQQNPIPVDSNVGRHSTSNCVLIVLVVFCILLIPCVLALCGAVLSLVKKENER